MQHKNIEKKQPDRLVGGTVQPQRVSAQVSLIYGNLQGKYALLAHLESFHAEVSYEFSALDTGSLRKLAGKSFGGSGNPI